MNIYIILTILFVHWFLDFVCQTSEQALGKSKSWGPLLEHTGTYSMLWFIPIFILGTIFNLSDIFVLFPVITFVTHTAIDYYTSRVNAQLWESKNVRGFFVSVGFDQFLHLTQLFLTFKLLAHVS